MSIGPFRRYNPVIPTTSIVLYNNDTTLFVTNGFTGALATPKFVLQVDQSVPYGDTFPTAMSDIGGNKVLLYDRLGYYARADRFFRAMQMRKNGCLLCNGCPNEFQCVIRFDPLRIYVLDALPPSVYTPTVNVTTVRTTGVTNGGANVETSTTVSTAPSAATAKA